MPAEWFEKYKIAILGVLLLAIIGLEIGQLIGGRSDSPAFVATPAPSGSASAKVYVSGEVNSPGVFQFGPGARVEHAIELAGGATSDADLDQINLAILLVDEQHVFVPANEDQRNVPALVDVNRAEVRELSTLEGIGSVSAEKLIAYRRVNSPFRSMDDLLAAGLTRTQVEKDKRPHFASLATKCRQIRSIRTIACDTVPIWTPYIQTNELSTMGITWRNC